MNMSVLDIDTIEIGQFINKLNGFYERERTKQKAEWERTNYQVYSALLQNPYIEKRDKPSSFEAYLNQQKKPTNLITTRKALAKSPLFKHIDLEE